MQQPTNAALTIQKTGQSIPLEQNIITVGRKSGNTIVLEDDLEVSRHHCAISPEDGKYIIRDVGSSNGTYLNNERLTQPQTLRDGDIIEIGNTTLIVHLPDADTRPSMMPPPMLDPDETMVSVQSPLADPSILKESMPQTSVNPYVGPRTFTQAEGSRFFGREREARELLSLVISERLVLFYAQSGAGKSSLINTRLIPQLREAGIPVLPIGRVSGELPGSVDYVENIFLFNLLLSLDESDGDPQRFTHMPLSNFLVNLTSIDGQHYYYDDSTDPTTPAEGEEYQPAPYVLVIDQFEEIITTHATRWPEREGFFSQLAQAMSHDPMLWVVLAMREDFIAALNPYTHLLPDNMRANFYMQRMSHESALEAIKEPAGQYNRAFAPGVAENLVDNLRQIKVHGTQAPGQAKTQAGQFVEPVQLQVVCYQLWENLKDRPLGQITQQDLDEMGNVDEALAQFYEQAVAEAVYQTGVSEIELRSWFETQLITEAGTRGTVYRGTHQTGGIDNRVVELLADKFILRSEARTGGTWYELVHDRFVEPILQDNQQWRLKQPLIQMAQAWEDSNRSASLLIEGQALEDALATNWQALGSLVQMFLETSQTAEQSKEQALQAEKLALAQAQAAERQQRLDEQSRLNKKVTRRNVWLSIFAVVMVLLALFAGFLAYIATQSAEVARQNAIEASRNEQAAKVALQAAEFALQTAVAAEAIAETSLGEAARSSQQAEAAAAEVVQLQETQTVIQEEMTMNELATQEARLTAQPQTATAEAALIPPTETPTATPTEPPTPTGTVTPNPPTATPTSTLTPTPNLAATATANAITIQESVLQATQTAVARCPRQVEGEFKDIWEDPEIKDRLICPLQSSPSGGYFAEQPFERGHMVWSQIFDLFIVAVGGENRGVWQDFTKEEVDSFGGNPVGPSCEADVPAGLIQPIRGFGIIWCANPKIQTSIGFGTTPEFGVEKGNAIQLFEGGIILRNHQNEIYVFFNDNNTYIGVQ